MIVLDWARENPGRRAVRAAKVVPYAAVDEKGTINWTRIALDLTALPGVGLRVLEEFRARFGIGIGFGPWHNRFVRRRPLLETLTRHDDPAVRDWAVAELYDLDQRVARMKEQERRRDERFE